MSKVLKVLSLSFLICLSLVIAPFHISANGSLSAPFVGYNIYYYDYDTDTYISTYNVDLDTSGFTMTCTNMLSSGGCNTYRQTSNEDTTGTISLKGSTGVHTNMVLKIELVLDNNYIGYVNLTHSGTSKNYYVNGNKIEIYTTDTGQTITVNSYQLDKVANPGITYIFPIESFGAISTPLNYGAKVAEYTSISGWIYPFFNVTTSDTLVDDYYSDLADPSQYKRYIFGYQVTTSLGGQINSDEVFKRYFGFYSYNGTNVDSEFVVEYENLLYRFQSGRQFRIASFKIRRIANNSGSSTYYIRPKASFPYLPIYWNVYDNDNISTDFAINFGLSNRVLDDLHIIAQGTSVSNQSSSNLDDKTSDLNTSSNQLVTQEDTFNNDMNSALQNIDTNFNVGTNFGSKFIASADWVKTQYDRLTGNTPFGSVISFSLLIGLALLLVGKVFK